MVYPQAESCQYVGWRSLKDWTIFSGLMVNYFIVSFNFDRNLAACQVILWELVRQKETLLSKFNFRYPILKWSFFWSLRYEWVVIWFWLNETKLVIDGYFRFSHLMWNWFDLDFGVYHDWDLDLLLHLKLYSFDAVTVLTGVLFFCSNNIECLHFDM